MQSDTVIENTQKLNIKYSQSEGCKPCKTLWIFNLSHLPHIIKCAVHCQPLSLVKDTEVILSCIRLLLCGEDSL